MKKNKSKFNFYLLILIIISGFLMVLLSLGDRLKTQSFKKESLNNLQLAAPTSTTSFCQIREEKRIVRGSSMEPVLKDGQEIKILWGYYQCYPVLREDIVIYNFKGNSNPIIKRVKGIEGDNFSLKKVDDGWIIILNGQPLKNSLGQTYLLSEKAFRMLSLYERDYQGKIPDKAYLILGENINGGLDSRFFGLVGKDDILGKVEF